MPTPTHRHVEQPQMGVRYLADYMAASKRGERSVLQFSRYRPLAKLLHHTEAKSTVTNFVQDGSLGADWLVQTASNIRSRLADDDFDRHIFDSNADYIMRYATIERSIEWPQATILPPGKPGFIVLNGLKINIGLNWRLQRTTRTNKVRQGAAMLRYAKGKALSSEVAAWQTAFLLGYLGNVLADPSTEPEGKLCLVVDAYAGVCHAAPTGSVSRYHNMKAACATIAEQWPNLRPPTGAVLD